MSVGSGILSGINRKKVIMNLDEFKAHVEATRQSSKAEAMSVLSATISTIKKEGSK